MRRSLFLLAGALALCVVIFAGSFHLAKRACVTRMAHSGDDLDWLRQEFHLDNGQMEGIRRLHDGYLPKCAEMCERIAAKRQELETALAGKAELSTEAQAKLTELAALRAQCQAQMLRHFIEVSQAMPSEQGHRYLAEMQRMTLGLHEKIEQSMSDKPSHAHGEH